MNQQNTEIMIRRNNDGSYTFINVNELYNLSQMGWN